MIADGRFCAAWVVGNNLAGFLYKVQQNLIFDTRATKKQVKATKSVK
jgi:hypothetical protein